MENEEVGKGQNIDGSKFHFKNVALYAFSQKSLNLGP